MVRKRKIRRMDFSTPIVLSSLGGSAFEVFPNATKAISVVRNRQHNLTSRITSKICPFCGSDLINSKSKQWGGFAHGSKYHAICGACGWWNFGCGDAISRPIYMTPFVQNFNNGLELAAMNALMLESTKNKKILFACNPRDFEVFVGSVLSDHFDCDVYHVGGKGDEGIDLLVVQKDKPLMVQVKRRKSDGAIEGLDVVKQLFASLFAKKANHGMVVTTAKRYTKGAIEFAKHPALLVSNFEIDLVNVENILDMIKVSSSGETFTFETATKLYEQLNLNYFTPIYDDQVDQYLIKVTSSGMFINNRGQNQYHYYFDKSSKYNCWLMTGSDFSDSTLVNSEFSFPIISRRGTEISFEKMLHLMSEFPEYVVNKLIRMWADYYGEHLVDLS